MDTRVYFLQSVRLQGNCDIPFQYNKIEGRFSEFTGYPIGLVFIAVIRNQEFLISQGRNIPNISSDSVNFWLHNTNKNCSNFSQGEPAHTSDSSHFTYCIWA